MAHATDSNGFEWEYTIISGNNISIIPVSCYLGDIVGNNPNGGYGYTLNIPSTLNGYTVTKLGDTYNGGHIVDIDSAFSYQASEYFEIVVPSTVTTIDINAFSCYNGLISDIIIKGNAYWEFTGTVHYDEMFYEAFESMFYGEGEWNNPQPTSININISCPANMSQSNFNNIKSRLNGESQTAGISPVCRITTAVFGGPLPVVTYNATTNGGTSTATTATTVNGKLSSLPTATKSGYTFAGWYPSSYDRSTQVTTSTVFSTDTAIYAHFYKDITLTYVANGATSISKTTETIRVWNTTTSATFTMPTITRSGYTVYGWDSGRSSHGYPYLQSKGYSFSSTYTLYAITRTSIHVNYIANGASLSHSSNIFNYWNDTPVPSTFSATLPTITRSGYNIVGFGTTANARTAISGYTSGADVSNLTAGLTLYAITRKGIYIDLVANGATVQDGIDYKYSSIYNTETITNIYLPSIIRDGFNIIGWGTSADATSAVYSTDSNEEFSEGTTLYAITSKDVTVTCNANGASLSAASVSGTIWNSATSISLKLPTITRSGYNIMGFSSAAAATSIISGYTSGASVSISNSITVYATTYKRLTLSCNANGATSIGSSTVTGNLYNTNTSINFILPTITRSGFTILGWGSSASATTANVGAVGASMTISANTSVYAVTYKAVSLTCYANGASLSVASVSGTIWNSATSVSLTLPTITRSGYTVVGFGTTNSATSIMSGYTSGATVSVSLSNIVYALTYKEITVTFNGNGSSAGLSSISNKIWNTDTDVAINMTSITRSGFTIVGWGTSAASRSKTYDVGISYYFSTNVTLYAVSYKDITITCNSNGATSSLPSVSGTIWNSATSVALTVPTITRSGFTIVGWGTLAENTTKKYTADTAYNFSADETIYAVTYKPITVTCNSNGTTLSAASVSGTIWNSATNVSIKLPTITRSGYNIVGFSNTAGATSIIHGYTSGATVSFSVSATIYAVTYRPITITCNGNGATIGASSVTGNLYNTNTSISLTVPTITRSGFTIVGWGTSSSATTSAYAVNTSHNFSASTTLYAVTYKDIVITCNGNGATSSTPSVSGTIRNSATSVSLTVPTITRSGYTIVGWGTSSGATTSAYAVSTSHNFSASATIYAVTYKAITITCDANGATSIGASSVTGKLYNTNMSVSLTVPTITRSGYNIKGWGTSSGATTKAYTANTAYNFSGSATIYAVTYKTLVITCNGNGATAGASSVTGDLYNTNTSISLTVPTITRSGFTIVGWGTSASSTAKTYDVSKGYDFSANATIYAVTYKAVTITCNSNGATSSAPSVSGTIWNSATAIALKLPVITRSGYTIVGWGTSSGATTKAYTANTTYNFSNSATIYAVTYKDIVITCNGNGATSPTPSVSGTIRNSATSASLKLPTITRSGYTIVGWGTTSGATTSAYAVSTSHNFSASATIYAVTYKTITITCNANGATSSPSVSGNMWNTATSVSIAMPAITRSGFTIVGWGTSSGATTSAYSVGTSYNFSANTTIYALTYKDITITCNGNGATLSAPSLSGTIRNSATSVSLNLPTITRSGYNIVGFSTSSGATSINSGYTPGATVIFTASTTIYAVTYKDIVITCNINGATSIGASSVTGKLYNTNMSVSLTVPTITRSGYTIVGWGTSAGATTSAYTVNTANNFSASATIYAVTYRPITITCNGNGATIGASSVTGNLYNTNTSISLTVPTITRSGFTIVGWGTSSGATTSAYAVNTAYGFSNSATIYAVTYKAITITCNGNGATSSAPTVSGTIWNSATSISLTVPTITRSGFTIVGWGTSSGATTKAYTANTAYNFSASTTLYAVTYKDIVITCNGNGATSSAPSLSGTIRNSATSVSLTVPTITRSGYNIVGWGTSAGATSKVYTVNTANNFSASVTIYAVTYKTVTVTCNSNGATSSLPSVSGNMWNTATSVALTVPTITRSGFTIRGWGTTSYASVSTYTPNTTYDFSDSATIYAVSYKDVTVACNGNGATSSAPNVAWTIWNSATAVSLTLPTITRSGYTIVGWSTSASSTSKTYDPGVAYDFTGNATLYAITYKTITITCNANGATVGSSSVTGNLYNTNTSISLTVPTITRSGYNIKGWGTSSGATTKVYTANTAYNFSDSATIYAVTYKTLVITCNGNGATSIGSSTVTENLYNTNTSVNIVLPDITRSGFTVLGWGTSASSTAKTYDVSKGYDFSANATIYAVTYKAVTITCNGNGAISSAPSLSGTIWNSATSVALTVPTITRSGYTIVGWGTTSGATTSAYAVSTSHNFSASATIYAVTYKAITITCDANGATSIGASSVTGKMYNANTSISLAVPAITRSGYTIVGWGTSASSTSKTYTADAANNFSASATIYAVTYKTITITCNANGATIGASSVTGNLYNTNTSISLTVPTITRSGFTIVGWGTSSGATTKAYTTNTAYNFSNSVAIYAVTYKDVTVTCNSNGATSSPSVSGTIWNSATAIALKLPVITRSGYTIVGWGSSSSSTSKTHTPGESYDFIGNDTLWAITYKAVTITCNGNGATSSLPSVSGTIWNSATSASLKLPTITRSGYTIVGWGSSSSATTANIGASDGVIPVSNSITIFAVTYKVVTLTFAANGATVGASSINVNMWNTDSYSIFTLPSITRSGFTIVGWGISAASQSSTAKPNELYYASSDVTLYAITYKVVSLIINGNGGSVSSSNPSGTIWNAATSISLAIPANAVSREGYGHSGWSSTQGSTVSNVTSPVSISKDTVIYALWTLIIYIKAKIKINGTQKTARKLYIKENGTWKASSKLFIKASGNWKQSTY